MISITVERAPADKQGNNISDSLITSVSAAVERGRQEIDANCSSRELVTSSGPYTGWMRPGRMIEVADAEQQVWRGMLTTAAMTITRDGDSITGDMSLTIEREAQP